MLANGHNREAEVETIRNCTIPFEMQKLSETDNGMQNRRQIMLSVRLGIGIWSEMLDIGRCGNV